LGGVGKKTGNENAKTEIDWKRGCFGNRGQLTNEVAVASKFAPLTSVPEIVLIYSGDRERDTALGMISYLDSRHAGSKQLMR
jgi:hypothetical protein